MTSVQKKSICSVLNYLKIIDRDYQNIRFVIRRDWTTRFLHPLTLPTYPVATSTPGGCHVPLSTCGCGRYVRKIRLNESVGAGSQLDSLSGPGF
jgi:hypothetical protein